MSKTYRLPIGGAEPKQTKMEIAFFVLQALSAWFDLMAQTKEREESEKSMSQVMKSAGFVTKTSV